MLKWQEAFFVLRINKAKAPDGLFLERLFDSFEEFSHNLGRQHVPTNTHTCSNVVI